MESLQVNKALFYVQGLRALCLSRMNERFSRTNGPSTLLLSLEKPFEVLDPKTKQYIETGSVLLPAGSAADIKTHSGCAAIFMMDGYGNDVRKLIPSMGKAVECSDGTSIYIDIESESELLSGARRLWKEVPDADIVHYKLRKWIDYYEQRYHDQVQTVEDHRVTQAIKLIRARCNENIPVSEIAKAVNISVPRLTQLFKMVTGTSIRSYRLWCRFYKFTALLQQGHSLTDASVSAGFSDYAHCYRLYRDFGGANLSKVKRSMEFRVAA